MGYGSNPKNTDVGTPRDFYELLDDEFHFNHDPCPLNGLGNEAVPDGLKSEWGDCCFVNPPFNDTQNWVKKGMEEWKKGKTIVFLVGARINSKYWFEEIWPQASEIRFLNRITFAGYKEKSPMPVAVVIFKKDNNNFKNNWIQTKGKYSWVQLANFA